MTPPNGKKIRMDKRAPKPEWLKRRLHSGETYERVFGLLRDSRLHTVCEEAHCPNLGECFSRGTSTFLILGDRCTRNCRFCAVAHALPAPPDEEEPERVARAIGELGLRYAVITSVTRDDLPDGGAAHFARTIREIRASSPGARVEVLIPDFHGSDDALMRVIEAGPEVINHNMETVPRLYPVVRPQADYGRSLGVLARVREMSAGIATKSGLMLGLGEDRKEVLGVLKDLLHAGCDLLTMGQYLSPSKDHLPVERFITPQEFADLEKEAYRLGFKGVASGPFVRSSFHAEDLYEKAGQP
jgi:lipoyl synthase